MAILKSEISWKRLFIFFLVGIFAAILILLSYLVPNDEAIYAVQTDDQYLEDILDSNSKIDAYFMDSPIRIDAKIGGEVKVRRSGKSISAFKTSIDTIEAHNRAVLNDAYIRNEIKEEELFPLWIKISPMDDLFNDNEVDEQRLEEDKKEIGAKARAMRSAPGDIRGALETAFTKTDYDELTTPEDLDKVLPIRTILIALIILTPIMFISTFHNSSFYNEKIEKKATLLFISPVSNWLIVFLKSLPYVLGSFLLTMGAAVFFNQNPIVLLYASLPILTLILLYFALNFLITVLSRSYKELSSLKTSLGSVFIAYNLLPALFVDLSDIAFISPLSTAVYLLEQGEIGLKQYAFSILPMLLAALVIYRFSLFMFDEENFYTQKPLFKKISDMVACFMKSPLNIFLLTLITFPLVIVVELVFLLVVALPSSQVSLLFILLIIVAAVTEEFFKNIGIYLIYSRKLFNIKPIYAGILSGSAFFIAEKGLLLLMIPTLATAYSKIILVALIIPLVFHSVTSFVFALLARKINHPAIFIVPIIMHISYGMLVFYLTGVAQ